MSIFQAREWWSAETEVASINEAADDEEEGDNDVVTGGDGVTGDDDTHLLKSVSVETASFASTMGNQVISVHITILPEVRIWRYWMLINGYRSNLGWATQTSLHCTSWQSNFLSDLDKFCQNTSCAGN